ncbi:MAG: rod shape-determining protein MreC [Chloroflexi bacterium]|nr:rod shape-determining protein MreC [Chloroflexota bacterium]
MGALFAAPAKSSTTSMSSGGLRSTRATDGPGGDDGGGAVRTPLRARRSVPGWVAILALVTAAGLIAAPGAAQHAEALGTRVMAPIELGISRVWGSLAYLWGTVQQAGSLSAQNRAYRDEIARLESQQVQMGELELENTDLRRLLDLRERVPQGTPLLVNVIAQDPLPLVRSLVIDRGADHGIAVNLPVITSLGLVGRVTKVHPDSAEVLLITDVNSSVSARIQDPDSRATGLAHGTGEGRLLLDYVPQEDPLRFDDLVITSVVGKGLPSGLPIGKVVQVRQLPYEVFQQALVEPAVDVRSLERLFVLLSPQDS